MNTYIYTGLDRKGQKVTGSLDAEDYIKVKQLLKERGLYVINVAEKAAPGSFFSVGGVRQDELVVAMRELATFVSAKLPLDECLTGVTSQMKNTPLRNVFVQLQKKIREGNSFSDAMKDFPRVFSWMMVSMVRVGEETGTLDNILVRLSDFLEKRQAFRNKIMSIMSYPIFMLVISIAVFVFILTFVTPTITRIFVQIDMPLPMPTEILISTSNFMRMAWFYIIIGLMCVFYAAVRFFATESGIRILDFIKMRLPLLKNIIIKKEIILFTRTISTLIGGGVDIIESLKISGQVVSSPSLKGDIERVIDFLSKGGSLSTAFRDSKYFPYLVTQLVSAGERSGTLAQMFDKIGEIYEEEVSQSSNRFVSFIEPVMILFMGVVIGMIVLAVLLPIFQISQSIR